MCSDTPDVLFDSLGQLEMLPLHHLNTNQLRYHCLLSYVGHYGHELYPEESEGAPANTADSSEQAIPTPKPWINGLCPDCDVTGVMEGVWHASPPAAMAARVKSVSRTIFSTHGRIRARWVFTTPANASCRGRCKFCSPDEVCDHGSGGALSRKRCIEQTPRLPCGDFTRADGSEPRIKTCDKWENPILEEHVNNKLHVALNQLRSGMSQDEISTWKNLKTLQKGWADAPVKENNHQIVPEDPGEPSTPSDQELLVQSQAVRDCVKMLQSCQVELPRTSNADHGHYKKIQAQAETRSREQEDEEPFDFCGANGELITRTLFTLSRSKQQSSRKRILDFPPEPEDSGVCKRCSMYSKELSDHEPSCMGQCEECFLSEVPCAHPPGKMTCARCEKLGKSCKKFSHKDVAVAKAKVWCDKCHTYKPGDLDTFYQHHRLCRGRCQPCAIATVPCERKSGVKKCIRCTDVEECIGHSHANQEDTGVCSKCLDTKDNLTSHEYNCRGRCEPCRNAGDQVPCRRKHGARKCIDCKTLEECCNFSHEKPKVIKTKATVDKKLCRRCLTRFPENTDDQVYRHWQRCPGRCTDKICVLANRVRPVCGKCGKSYANNQSRNRHQKYCTAKPKPDEDSKPHKGEGSSEPHKGEESSEPRRALKRKASLKGKKNPKRKK
ncbi:hypothetical protein F66182_6013 [Fusarium sp. NRRL 66182]|nr:hypothetical protein F66182_6013 [Fusarium sp. NRRL 66182]